MNTTWPTVPLDDLCDRITVGHVGSMASEYQDEGVPMLRSQNIQPFRIEMAGIKFISPSFHERLRKSSLQPGDVAVVRTGYPGTAAVVPGWLTPANCADLVVITPGDALDASFLAAIFNSAWGIAAVGSRLVGAAQQHFNVGAAKRLEVHLPPLPTQRKIVSILSAYDDLIENNNRRIKILEEMAQRIYREWFVDFRYPGHEGVPLVESELGLIPQGWEMRTLSQLGNLVMGQSPPSSAYNEIGDGLPFHQGVRFYGVHYPVHQIFSVVGTRVAEEGDTLVSVRAPVGRINIADRQMILGRGLCAVRADKAPQSFLLHALKHFFREEDAIGNGAIFNAVNRKEMEMLPLAWAGDALAQAFNVLASPIWSQIRCLSASIDNQRATRDLLLPRLVSGEIDVSDLDIKVPEAA